MHAIHKRRQPPDTMPDSIMPLLRLDNVSLAFGHRALLDGVLRYNGISQALQDLPTKGLHGIDHVAQTMTGRFGCNHRHINIFRRANLFEVNIKPMREHQHAARLQVRTNRFPINLCLTGK